MQKPAVHRGPSFGLVFDVYELREVQGLYWALTYGVQSDFVVTALAVCSACLVLFRQQKGRLVLSGRWSSKRDERVRDKPDETA